MDENFEEKCKKRCKRIKKQIQRFLKNLFRNREEEIFHRNCNLALFIAMILFLITTSVIFQKISQLAHFTPYPGPASFLIFTLLFSIIILIFQFAKKKFEQY